MSKLAVIYARFSSDKQREESIEGQIRECTAFADANDIKIVGTYIDRAMSARTADRPQFQAMIRDSSKHTFDYVIVYQLDRFARNRYDSATCKAKLKKNGVRVLSAKENIKDDPSGIILESVLEGMAEYYSAELAVKVKRGMTENVLEGKWPGGSVPLGYKLNAQKHLEIDPVGAECIRFIFKKYLDGWPRVKIIKYLNERQYKTSKGKSFSRSSLNTILRNQIYAGLYAWKDVPFPEGSVPAIISASDFEKVQECINQRKTRLAAPSDVYLLTGKLYCGQCGATMIGMSGTSQTGIRHFYYACLNKRHQKQCTSKNIRRDDLEKLILQKTVSLLQDKNALELITDQAMKIIQHDQADDIELKNICAQIDDISARLKNCMNAVDNGLVTASIVEHIKDYEKQLETLKDAKETAERKKEAIYITADHVRFFLQSLVTRCNEKTNKYKDDLFSAFIRQVIVYDDYIEIRYNYKKELPTLPNPVTINSSFLATMVDRQGIEPWTP